MSAVGGYAFPRRALVRWAGENLRLRRTEDGHVHAVFRLEGSTCGNVAFALDYRVTLGPVADGRRVLAAEVGPAEHDVDHRAMCAAKADWPELARVLREETPLAGEPLEACLAWSPATTPEGCLCAATARAHKWRAVLQTIRFALTESHEDRTRP